MMIPLLRITFALSIIMNAQVVAAQEQKVKIALIGDSTVTTTVGWGNAFAGRFNSNVEVVNFAVGGRSAKSWFDEKRLPEVLNTSPDYVFIQFGHNGQPGKGPARETDPSTTYREYLRTYVTEFRKIDAKPIIVSSVTRRKFDATGKIASTLSPWAEAAKTVAQELNIPFVDLHAASIQYHNSIGTEASMAFNPKEGDLTHFNKQGAEAVTDLIMKELETVAKALHAFLK